MLPSAHQTKPLALTVLAIIFIEGFITISVEILTIRQLVPFVGNNVTVTSLVIGVFLLFLAYGYRQGGAIHKHFAEKLNRNFLISALLLGFGLSYPIIEIFFKLFLQIDGLPLSAILISYLLLITAPLVYLLGQTVPITMNLIENERVGKVGGKVLHLSTLGSFLGAVVTSLVLFHTFGVSATVFFNYVLLFILVVIISLHLKQSWLEVILLAGMALIVFKLNVEFESLAFVKTNNYANYSIVDTTRVYGDKGKMIIINNTPASYIDAQNRGFPYIELMKTILFNDLKLNNQEILVLGAGGFTLSEGVSKEHSFTYVDIDPDLTKVVQKHFLETIHGDIINQDARVYVKNTSKQYDVIVSDLFNNPSSMPSHVITKEYFEAVHRVLKPSGYALFNFIMEPTMTSVYAKRLDNTVRSAFKACANIPVGYKNSPTNVIYVCHKGELELDDTVYTDDVNQAELDSPLPRY